MMEVASLLSTFLSVILVLPLISLHWLFILKFVFSKKASKIDDIFTVYLTLTTQCQIDVEDFVNFCGFLRKHELYICINPIARLYSTTEVILICLKILRQASGIGLALCSLKTYRRIKTKYWLITTLLSTVHSC